MPETSHELLDVAVIGAGIVGSATAWVCSRRGLNVALFEQFELGHTRGSSHGRSRIFRFAYDDPAYVRLAQQALPLWRQAERELGTALLEQMGGLDLGPRRNLEPIARALAECAAPYQLLSRGELGKRLPAFRIPEGWQALFQPEAGVINADAARLSFVELARRNGTAVFPETKVLAIEPDTDCVRLRTTDGTHRAQRAVVSGAGWSNGLLAPLGLAVPLTVTREHVVYYEPGDEPVIPFIWHADATSPEFYGLPNGDAIKLGEHGTGPVVDPDSVGVVEEARLTRVNDFVRDHLPGIGGRIGAETCLYAVSPDDDFIMDRIENIVLACGFGGHGFKFGPMIGEMAAELVEGKEIAPGMRFARGRFLSPAASSG